MSETLADALPKELARVRGILELYRSLGPSAALAARLMELAIARADRASAEGDVVGMLRSLKELRDIEE